MEALLSTWARGWAADGHIPKPMDPTGHSSSSGSVGSPSSKSPLTAVCPPRRALRPGYGPPMTYASGKLSSTLAEVNRSGTIQIAWTAARPETIAQLLRAHGTPASFDALSIDIDSDEVALVRAILEGGFSPRAIAVNFNPDLPPPIYLESHLGGEDRQPRADAGRHLPVVRERGLGSGSALSRGARQSTACLDSNGPLLTLVPSVRAAHVVVRTDLLAQTRQRDSRRGTRCRAASKNPSLTRTSAAPNPGTT